MNLNPEPEKITIEDIARAAKVSKSTVSRVLNKNTPVNESKRKAVLKAMERLNFQPNIFARGLAGGRSMTVGIVTQNIGSPFYDAVAHGILEGLANSSYSPIFADGMWKAEVERAAISTLLGRQVDGLIIVGGNISDGELLEIKEKKPTIVVARKVENWGNQCIFVDNFEGARKATRFLIDSGHKKIAHIRGIAEHEDAIERFEGYKQALKDAGLTLEKNLIVDGNFDCQSGLVGMETLFSRGKVFTAVFAANDEMAIGARLAMFRRGIRVPDDISLMGFDDQPLSLYMTPPLTTVRQPAIQMGKAAGKALLDLLDGSEIEKTDLPIEVIVRETVAIRR